MARTLAAFAASDAPPRERLRVAHGLVRAVAELHARGRVHGALSPERAWVVAGGAVVLAPPGPDVGPLAAAPFGAPEVARGRSSSRRSDVFSAGALAWLVLAGRPPFDAPDPLERLRGSLYADPGPLRLAAPEAAEEVETVLAAALEKRPRRRPSARALAETIGAALEVPEGATSTVDSPVRPERSATEAARSRGTPTPTPTSTPTSTPTPTPIPTTLRALAAAARRQLPPIVARARALAAACAARVRGLPPLRRRAAAALAVLAVLLPFLPERDAALEREVVGLVERGELATARRRLEAFARRRPGDALVEKLRGDVACAAREAAACLRHYRVALARRPALREDRTLRANARRLIRPAEPCGTRRAAAWLLGELRDPDALPALEEARRSGGLFASLCTGDALERAITATRSVR